MYITLSQASAKYNISRGKLQVLCRSDKIPGAYKSGGIWLIPDDVSSSSATFAGGSYMKDTSSDATASETSMTIQQLCNVLSISKATAKNWLRLGKIHTGDDGKFDSAYVRSLCKQIAQGDNLTLKRRRNKKSLTESKLYDGYISNAHNYKVIESFVQRIVSSDDVFHGGLNEKASWDHEDSCAKVNSIDTRQARLILATFAIEMYAQAKGSIVLNSNTHGSRFFIKSDGVFGLLIEDLLGGSPGNNGDRSSEINCLNASHSPFQFGEEIKNYAKQIKYVPGEDTLGFIYSSLRSLGDRKSSGSYFTPAAVVDKLVTEMQETLDLSNKAICDPCCGTGIFIMKLALTGVPFENLYGHDLDEISIKLARINVFLLWLSGGSLNNYEGIEPMDEKDLANFLFSHFTIEDSLLSSHMSKYDVIIGNPPWGANLPKEYIYSLAPFLDTAKSGSYESSDIFVEKAIKALPPGGLLGYVLPEAILSVGTHRDIRRIMVQNATFKFVHYLGNTFSGVQCPSVILGLEKTVFPVATTDADSHEIANTAGCRVFHNTSYIIGNERSMTYDSFSFNVNNPEYLCIEAIDSVHCPRYLRGNSKFGLGIVTGDNKKFVTSVKSQGCEPILRGNNVFRYSLADSGEYISFQPEKFQQVAPPDIYRAKEKLVYRFICRVPVFALDCKQTLSLNSCNVLIPQIDGLGIKYVLAVLNSSVAAFYLGKKYNSVKLLRSHIESLPIPWVSAEKQRPIIHLADDIMVSDGSDKLDLYRELDGMIGELYGLDEGQMALVKGYAEEGNMFLMKG